MLPTLHPRVPVVNQAQLALDELILKLEKEHKLTASELFMMLSTSMKSLASGCVRSERDTEGE